jgi:hypothetical protein
VSRLSGRFPSDCSVNITLFGDVWGRQPSKLINIDQLTTFLTYVHITSQNLHVIRWGCTNLPWAAIGQLGTYLHEQWWTQEQAYTMWTHTSSLYVRVPGDSDHATGTLKLTSNMCQLVIFLFVAMISNTYCKTTGLFIGCTPMIRGSSWFFSLWQVGQVSHIVSFAFCEGSFSYLVSFIFSLKVDGLVWIRTKTTNIHSVVSLFWPFCAALASGNRSKGCNQAIRNIIYLHWGCSPAKQHCLSKVNHHSYVL